MLKVLEQITKDLLLRGISLMQKEHAHMRREVHHTLRDTIQLLKEEIPTQKVQIHRRRTDKNTLKAGSIYLTRVPIPGAIPETPSTP